MGGKEGREHLQRELSVNLGMHVGQLVFFSQCDRMQGSPCSCGICLRQHSAGRGQVWGRWMLMFIQGWNFAKWWDVRTEEGETVQYLEGSN